jgi:hypothetical protein
VDQKIGVAGVGGGEHLFQGKPLPGGAVAGMGAQVREVGDGEQRVEEAGVAEVSEVSRTESMASRPYHEKRGQDSLFSWLFIPVLARSQSWIGGGVHHRIPWPSPGGGRRRRFSWHE